MQFMIKRVYRPYWMRWVSNMVVRIKIEIATGQVGINIPGIPAVPGRTVPEEVIKIFTPVV